MTTDGEFTRDALAAMKKFDAPETFDVHSRLSQEERRLLDCDISASGAPALTEAELLRQAALMSSEPLIRILPTRAHINALVDLAREQSEALKAFSVALRMFAVGDSKDVKDATDAMVTEARALIDRAEALLCD